jgi:hypothetical protein
VRPGLKGVSNVIGDVGEHLRPSFRDGQRRTPSPNDADQLTREPGRAMPGGEVLLDDIAELGIRRAT